MALPVLQALLKFLLHQPSKAPALSKVVLVMANFATVVIVGRIVSASANEKESKSTANESVLYF